MDGFRGFTWKYAIPSRTSLGVVWNG